MTIGTCFCALHFVDNTFLKREIINARNVVNFLFLFKQNPGSVLLITTYKTTTISFNYFNNQCSLTIIVIHYKESDSKIEHKSIVFFSDNLIHDAVALYLIQEIIIKYIKISFGFVKKVIKSALKTRLFVSQVTLSGTVYIALATLVR